VRNFLELLLGGDQRQAHNLMLPSWRKTLSPLPPDFKSKEDLDYEPAFLIRALRAWASGATTFALSNAKLSQNGDEATFAVELDSAGTKIPHTVRAKRTESSQWLVAGFDN
jgi:hypothetical protein